MILIKEFALIALNKTHSLMVLNVLHALHRHTLTNHQRIV